MSRDVEQEHISRRAVVYRAAGAEAVEVRRDVAYGPGAGDARTMDIYYPPGAREAARVPAVVIVAGYPDAGFEAGLGCKFKEMGATVSWGRLLAASGVAAVAYANREPAADLQTLLRHVRSNADALGLDGDRLGLLASSGNVPLALWALMQAGNDCLRCAALCYGYTLDEGGATGVAEAARAWGFADACAGRSVADLPPDVPLFVVRAGRDQLPRLNETLDRFLLAALARNLPLTVVNHHTAPHAFDLYDDTEATREVIRQILAFMRFHLSAGTARRDADGTED